MAPSEFYPDRLPTYDEIINRNSITLLMEPGDFVIRDGDLAVTRWGDLMLNNEDYSAFYKLVQFWRYNFLTLQTLFQAASDTESEKIAQQHLDTMSSRDWDPSLGLLQGFDANAYHAANDHMDAREGARGIYAGSIALVISRVLATFRADIAATIGEWKAAGPRTSGHSVGEILEAAGNNIRHADEWRTTMPPTPQQLKSVSVLSAALGEPIPPDGSIRSFARDIGPEILKILCNGDFLRLETAIFAFANDLLRRRRLRKPSAN